MKKKYKLINLNKVVSTNLELKKLINSKKIKKNLCISAEKQTNGYGRRSTKWFSYKGNVHLSIFLKPLCKIEKINQLSFLTTISIGDSLKKIKNNININYKWPNDILLNKKKIGGVLLETSSNFNRDTKWVIIGLGLNIKKFPLLKNQNIKISSMFNEKINLDKNHFIKIFLETFFENYENWNRNGFSFIKKKWISNVYKKDNKIVIKYKNKLVKGELVSLLLNGSIKLKKNNNIKNFYFGDQIV